MLEYRSEEEEQSRRDGVVPFIIAESSTSFEASSSVQLASKKIRANVDQDMN
jgi:hypothetical protein